MVRSRWTRTRFEARHVDSACHRRSPALKSPISFAKVSVIACATLLLASAAVLFAAPSTLHRTLTKKGRGMSPNEHAAKTPATLALIDGDIYTVASPAHAPAIAIQGEEIVAVGTNDDVRTWIGTHTHVIDLHGRFAMPGFNDAHTHLASAGMGMLTVNLEGAKSLAEFQ